MAPTAMACVCGTIMTPVRDGATVKWCLNCDQVQDREHCTCDTTAASGKPCNRGDRIKTPEDRRFHLGWEQLKRTYYGT